jgi:hypothetical protein
VEVDAPKTSIDVLFMEIVKAKLDLKFRTVSKSTKDREEEDGSETKIIGKLL